jgi:hypothetical protein
VVEKGGGAVTFEEQWLTDTNPAVMLRLLDPEGPHPDPAQRGPRPKSPPSSRKLRLFACACCRAVWGELTDARSRRAVEVAESFAENPTAEAAMDVRRACGESDDGLGHCVRSLHREPRIAAENAAFYARQVDGQDVIQTSLLREIFGNPYRQQPPARWREPCDCTKPGGLPCFACGHCQGTGTVEKTAPWLTRQALSVATAVYEGGLWDDALSFGVLADALEESGCGDDDVLAHLRSPGTHVRGCWAVDLILGKS